MKLYQSRVMRLDQVDCEECGKRITTGQEFYWSTEGYDFCCPWHAQRFVAERVRELLRERKAVAHGR